MNGAVQRGSGLFFTLTMTMIWTEVTHDAYHSLAFSFSCLIHMHWLPETEEAARLSMK